MCVIRKWYRNVNYEQILDLIIREEEKAFPHCMFTAESKFLLHSSTCSCLNAVIHPITAPLKPKHTRMYKKSTMYSP